MIMTNKERLKSVIEEDINPKNYYNEIVMQIEKGEKRKMKNNLWKWSFVPVCLVGVISGVLFLNHQQTIFKSKPYVDDANNVTLNINEIPHHQGGIAKIDADIKIVTGHDVNFQLPYKKGVVNLPKDLDKTYKYIVYFRENKESKEYNILGNYEIEYSNGQDRSIQVKYSKEDKPARDYYFSDEGSKTTMINGIELKIYQFEHVYFTEFEFNGYYFDIETCKITEQELSNFLFSILG